MNKQRKTSNILNVFQYDETTGAVTLPSTLVLTAPASNDNSTKVGTTAWVRTYVSGLSYLTGNQSITVSGDATGSGTTSIALTLANTAVTPGTYGSTTLVPVVTVDSKGRITSVTTAAISGSLTFTGDVTGSGTTGTSTALTLAASGVTAGTYTKVTVDSKGRVTVGASATTSDISEGTNLYYTDARVLSYLGANNYATQSYVTTQINNLVAGAPGLLDTLDELAAALGDDANFATTTATSLGNRLRIDIGTQGLTSTQQGYGRTNLGLGSLATLSSIGNSYITDLAWSKLSSTPTTISGYGITNAYTDAQIQNFFNGANAISGYNKTNWDTAYGWGNHASAGYLTTSSAASTYQPLDADLTAIAALGTTGFLKRTGANTWSLDTNTYLTSYTETDPYRVTAVAVSGTSTKTITLTRADASTVTTTWTDIDTDTNTYVTSAGFSGGTLTLTRNDAGTVTVSLDGRYYLASNPSSYITSSSLTSYVPYTGATANIDTGGYSITAGAVTLTSNLWLKNIGTYDFIMSNGTSVTTNTIRAYYNTSDELRFYAKNTAGSAVVPKIMVGDGTTFYTIYHTGNIPTIPTNNNQLTNGAGYITSSGSISGNAATASNASALGGYAQDFQTVVGTGDYLIIRNQAANKLSLASWASVQSGLGLGSLAYSSATIPTNNNQLTNGAGYITGYSETDTLASVTGRGATTTSTITINKTGTLISHSGMTDAIGYNASYGTYIGSPVGGTYYIYANGQMNNNGTIVTLLHTSNYSSTLDGRYLYATSNPSTAGNFTLSIGNNGSYSYVQSHSSQPLELNPLGNTVRISGNVALHAGNYTSYSPTLTGGSASGTWGISITGNAATATYTTNSTRLYASDGVYVYGGAAPYYMYMNYDGGSYWELKVSPATPGTVKVAYANSAGNAATVGGYGAGSFFRDLGFEGGGSNANTIAETRSAFTYAAGAPHSGPLAYFGAAGYGLQLNATYHTGDQNISYRVRNGDAGTFKAWYSFITSANIASQTVSYATSETLATITARGASTSTSITAADFYTAGWFRNSTALNGLYNSAYDTHFYASGTGQWNFATSNNSWIQIALRPANHQSTVRGYLYADTSNNVGLLTYDGNWGFRVDASKNAFVYGTDLTVGTSTSSNIYMTDTDETTRRIHCNSGRIGFLNSSASWGAWNDNTGNWRTDFSMYASSGYFYASGGIRLGDMWGGNGLYAASGAMVFGTESSNDWIFSNGAVTKAYISAPTGTLYAQGGITDTGFSRILTPKGGYYQTTASSVTGAIKITQPFLGGAQMSKMTVKIYEYSTGKSFTITVCGHRDGNSWYNVAAYQYGDTAANDITVRFGHDGTYNCIWIGEVGQVWSYPQVFITDIQNGYSSINSVWNGNWTISFVGAFNTVMTSRVAKANASRDGTGASGTWGINVTGTAGSAPNASNINNYYDTTAGTGYGFRFWNGSDNYKISMGASALYYYGPVTDYSIKTQMNDGDTGRGFTWGRISYAPIAALNSTSGNMQIAGTMASAGGTMTGQLNMFEGAYTGTIRFGSTAYWSCGISQRDAANAEMRIWAKGGASGSIYFATGYDGELAAATLPTDGMALKNNNLGIGGFTNTEFPVSKLHVKGRITVQNGDNSGTYYGPNATWGAYLYVGAAGTYNASQTAQVISTDGNLHLDSGTASKEIYMNYYSGQAIRMHGATKFYNTSYYSNNILSGLGNIYFDGNYGYGMVGLYSSTVFQGIFAMGDSYKLTAGGGMNNLYGLTWSHPNAGGQAAYLDSHGLIVAVNGVCYSAISNSIWARGNITANGNMYANTYYMAGNTAKYIQNFTGSHTAIYIGGSQSGYSGFTVDGGMRVMVHTAGVGAPCGFYHEGQGWSSLFYVNGTSTLMYAAADRISTQSYGVYVTGEIRASSDITAYYSDIRLKKDIDVIPNAIEKIKKLRGVTYTWNEEEVNVVKNRSGQRDIGLIAQEVEAIEPLFTKEYQTPLEETPKDANAAANFTPRMSETYKTIKYDKLVALLVEGMKEQQLQIEELKNKLDNVLSSR